MSFWYLAIFIQVIQEIIVSDQHLSSAVMLHKSQSQVNIRFYALYIMADMLVASCLKPGTHPPRPDNICSEHGSSLSVVKSV